MGSKRKSSDENGDGKASPTRSGGSKRCCYDRRDRGYTLDEFMKKLNPGELQQVQKLCQKYGINAHAPEISSRECEYRFQFKNVPDTLYTDTNFKAEIELVDASNNVISSGPMATCKIEIVVLEGDIDVDENGEWTEEQFKNFVLKPRKDKGPLLIGNLPTRLCDGSACISDVRFTDNSSWTKTKKFRLGVRGIDKQVQEGISKDFRVLDRHMKGLQKDHPPSMNDKVYHLKGISKDGTFHKKLVECCQINTVSDLLSYCNKNDPEKLRDMIGMKKGNWKKAYGQALQSRERPDSLLSNLVNPPAPHQIIGGNWEKIYGHASESMEWPDILLNDCLLNLPGPDQNFCELNGSSSYQTSNVLVQHNVMSISAQGMAAPVGFESGNSSKTIFIINEWVSFEDLLEENGRSYRGKWLILVFIAWLKKAARKAQKSKLSETSSPRPQKSKLCEISSPRQNDDESGFRNSPILSLTPMEAFYEAWIYRKF